MAEKERRWVVTASERGRLEDLDEIEANPETAEFLHDRRPAAKP